MSKSLLLAIVNSKMKGKRKVMVVSDLRLGGVFKVCWMQGAGKRLDLGGVDSQEDFLVVLMGIGIFLLWIGCVRFSLRCVA